MLESVLQRKIQKYLKDNLPNAVVWKNHGNQYSVIGLPDIMCVYEGKIICIEVKMPGNTPTKLQEITLKKLKEAGKQIGICHRHIGACCKGKRKTTGGYHWKYIEQGGGYHLYV